MQKLIYLIYPFGWIYLLIVKLRNWCFYKNILKSKEYKTPTICIGNITVGGTGKTPHTEYLLSLLSQDFKTAMLSRGYKRKTIGLQIADKNSTSNSIGDEPYQIFKKFKDTLVVVDSDRCRAIEHIESEYPSTEVIILDDAYQHRYVKAGLNILLIDYNRLIINDKILPYGNLREPRAEQCRADIIVITKAPSNFSPMDMRVVKNQINLAAYQKIYFTHYKYGQLKAVFSDKKIDFHKTDSAILVTGLANTQSLTDYLADKVNIERHYNFSDHYNFKYADYIDIYEKFDNLRNNNKYIIVTEKDAAKIINDKHIPKQIKPFIYSLPIEVEFFKTEYKNKFKDQIFSYVRKNKSNSDLS